MYDKDEEETQRGLRSWLPPSRAVVLVSWQLVSGPWTVQRWWGGPR